MFDDQAQAPSSFADLPRRMNQHLAIGPQELSMDAAAKPQRFHVEAGRGVLELRLTSARERAVQWLQNGQPISGATGPVLRLGHLKPADTDLYQARIGDGDDAALTQTCHVVVVPNLSLADQSARGHVSPDNPLICGFVIGRGSGAEANQPYLIRVLGPSLTQFGVEDPLVQSRVSLQRRGHDIGHLLIEDRTFHDTWAPQLGAFALPEASSEFVARTELPAGSYTLMVECATKASGTALVEIYAVHG